MPLDSKPDKELVILVQGDNSSDAMRELISRHSGVVSEVARKFCGSTHGSGMSLMDLHDEIPYIVWQAATTYEPDHGAKFSTWLYNKTRYELLNRKRKLLRNVETVELTDEICEYVPAEEPELISADDEEKIQEMKDSIKSLKNNRNRAIIQKRFFDTDCQTVGEIAKQCDCSPQYVSLVNQNFIKKQKQLYYER